MRPARPQIAPSLISAFFLRCPSLNRPLLVSVLLPTLSSLLRLSHNAHQASEALSPRPGHSISSPRSLDSLVQSLCPSSRPLSANHWSVRRNLVEAVWSRFSRARELARPFLHFPLSPRNYIHLAYHNLNVQRPCLASLLLLPQPHGQAPNKRSSPSSLADRCLARHPAHCNAKARTKNDGSVSSAAVCDRVKV